MKLAEFFNKVEDDERLEGFGIDLTGGVVFVRDTISKSLTSVTPKAVEENTWQDLKEILIGARDIEVIFHFSRVVGYFSRVENWNKSKVGELADRQRGNYSV